MSAYTIILGNKNYSSWSLRAWLAMKQTGAPFEERLLPIFEETWREDIAKVSPSRKVPVLLHQGRTVWESLAIIEYLAERIPEAGLWPADGDARAAARAVAAEMHAGFVAVRTHMPMNQRKSLPGKGRGEGVDADVGRITELWRDCRARFGSGGAFLFGGFSGADCMYAPVASRFRTYGVDLDDICAAYADAVLAWPAMAEWTKAARQEPWIIDEDEIE